MGPMRAYVGTSGYNFDAWRGTFYPRELPADQWLGFYATRLTSVEINYTFYRTPSTDVVAGWAGAVPETFRLTLKASQRLTHKGRLNDQDSTAYFCERMKPLGDRSGALLVQLPPFLRKDVERLRTFLTWLPAHVRPALEFRHKSWFDDEVKAVLTEHRAALCIADDGELDVPVWATADYGYLRLRRDVYTPDMLAHWADQVRAQPWKEVFAYFKHEDAATGVPLAQDLQARLGA